MIIRTLLDAGVLSPSRDHVMDLIGRHPVSEEAVVPRLRDRQLIFSGVRRYFRRFVDPSWQVVGTELPLTLDGNRFIADAVWRRPGGGYVVDETKTGRLRLLTTALRQRLDAVSQAAAATLGPSYEGLRLIFIRGNPNGSLWLPVGGELEPLLPPYLPPRR